LRKENVNIGLSIIFLSYLLGMFTEELPRYVRETRNWKLETCRSVAAYGSERYPVFNKRTIGLPLYEKTIKEKEERGENQQSVV
jgi:hypothetical protein